MAAWSPLMMTEVRAVVRFWEGTTAVRSSTAACHTQKAVRIGMHQRATLRGVSRQQPAKDAEACSEGGSAEMKARQKSAVCSSSSMLIA